MKWLSEFYIWEEKVVNFLKIPEMQKGIQVQQQEKSKFTLEVKGDFSWGFVEKKDVNISNCLNLKNMDIQAKRGDLILIVGKVGCGKTSVLNAIGGNLIYVP